MNLKMSCAVALCGCYCGKIVIFFGHIICLHIGSLQAIDEPCLNGHNDRHKKNRTLQHTTQNNCKVLMTEKKYILILTKSETEN